MRARLLAWFDAARRDLPWRRTSDPYRIWVSEVMLQQTQVERVVAYYERFVGRFPTLEALAAAPLDEVLKLWEGLGYYARARALHAAAREVTARFEGRLPTTADALRELPGFGAYTSAAVASIAFGEASAAVDANVIRVIARVYATSERAAIGRAAAEMLDPGRPGDFNQAVMELGAMICRPRAPRCLLCPLAESCRARVSGDPERWPARPPRAERATVHAACVLVVRRGRVLLVQRPERGLLGGLWEFPGGRIVEGETPAGACERGVLEKTGVRVAAESTLGEVRHAFSHFRVVLHVFRGEALGGRVVGRARWTTRNEIEALALTATARKASAWIE